MAKSSKKPSAKSSTSDRKAAATRAGEGAKRPTAAKPVAPKSKPTPVSRPSTGATKKSVAKGVSQADARTTGASSPAAARPAKKAVTSKSAAAKSPRLVAEQRDAAKVVSTRARPGARSRPAGPAAKSKSSKASAGSSNGTGAVNAPNPLPYRLPVSSPAFAIEAARLLRGLNCTDIIVLDVRTQSQLADYLVLASGTSDRQMATVADAVAALARERGEPVKSSASDTRTTWSVVDCIDTIVHVFEPSTRAYYDLETIHEGAKRIDWEDGAPKLRSGATTAGEPGIDEAQRTSDEARVRARSRTRTERE